MLRKTIGVAIVAGALAAMALPTAATAMWSHHTNPIQQNVTLGITGTNVKFQGGIGGVECQVTMRVKLEPGAGGAPGTTGLVETFVPHPKDETTNCTGLGGLAPCQIHELTPHGLPWTIHNNTKVIDITNGKITSKMTGGIFCLVKLIEIAPGTMTLTPDGNGHTVSTGQLSGQVQKKLQTNSGTVDQEVATVSGVVHVEGQDAGTYSLTPVL